MNVDDIAALTIMAGRRIMDIYEDKALACQVEWKADHSPLTLADKAAHEILVDGLTALYPDIPILSEEGRDIPYSERKDWETFWCVDPLDGTREFVNRNGEFTVNVALIQGRKPVLGVIYVPVSKTVYLASPEFGAWKRREGEVPQQLAVVPLPSGWTAVGSRSHANPAEQAMLKGYPVTKVRAVGSSVKFGLLAEGAAQIYFRHGPTMEWDTAAGHAILNHSGGSLTDPEGKPFLYNKETLRNGSFLCLASSENQVKAPSNSL